MTLAEIVSVSQMPGIFKVIGKKQDGLIVKSLVDGKSQFLSGRTNMFSTLDNITLYTTEDPIALVEVLREMKKQSAKNPPVAASASEADIKAYIKSIIPNYDTQKVYFSDMKKLLKWYSILEQNQLIDELIAVPAESDDAAAEETSEESKPKKTTKKAAGDDTATKEAKATKPKTTASKAKVSAPKTQAPPKKITTPRKAS
jgi:hypothetical protein